MASQDRLEVRFVEVGSTLARLAPNAELDARGSFVVLALILLTVGICSVLHAVAKPFWNDEVVTAILCRLPGASAIWDALDHAADGHPPLMYLVARFTRRLVSDEHVGYRIPSILGLLGAVSCIYFILSKRVSHLSALVGASFLLCTPAAAYAYEARPYALVLGCVSAAVLAWQRLDNARIYSVALTAALAASISLHYYAILVWPAFLTAEASVWIFRHRFRKRAWATFLVGAMPLWFYLPFVQKIRHYYGPNFWTRPSIDLLFFAYDWFFGWGGRWGWTFVAGISAIFLYFIVGITRRGGLPGPRRTGAKALPLEELTMALMLLWLPLLAVAATKITHNGLADRYMLPTVLGGALALGYAIDSVPSLARVFLLSLFLTNYASTSFDVVGDWINGSLLQARVRATLEVSAIAEQQGDTTLPVVISDELRYLPMAYYTPPDWTNLYTVADPEAAANSSPNRSDSPDLALLVLRQYFPLQVEDYADFTSKHSEFLLVLGGGGFDWWPARLVRDGYMLKLVSAREGTLVFKATIGR